MAYNFCPIAQSVQISPTQCFFSRIFSSNDGEGEGESVFVCVLEREEEKQCREEEFSSLVFASE